MIRVLVIQCEPGLEALVPADASNGALLLFLWTQVWGPDLTQGGKRHGLKNLARSIFYCPGYNRRKQLMRPELQLPPWPQQLHTGLI